MIYLQITLNVSLHKRKDALAKYYLYRDTILQTVNGIKTMELLMREDDFQVLHIFDSKDNANAYQTSDFFINDVMGALKPLLEGDPYIRIYQTVEVSNTK
jgi:heme-degrading monooxygenase HmoA